MANHYRGFLLKFGAATLPKGILTEYISTPNRRSEADATIDQTGGLVRSTFSHYRTTIKFSTKILDLDKKIRLQSIINQAITDSRQRKGEVTYWNDEINEYRTSNFYIPDIEFSVMDFDGNTIMYNPITVELIEY